MRSQEEKGHTPIFFPFFFLEEVKYELCTVSTMNMPQEEQHGKNNTTAKNVLLCTAAAVTNI